MQNQKNAEIDSVAEATFGKFHSTDPGMDDTNFGYGELGNNPEYPKGTRVEVKSKDGTWHKGTVHEPFSVNERAIVVRCDQKVHDHLENLDGHGATIWIANNTKRAIMSMIRKISS